MNVAFIQECSSYEYGQNCQKVCSYQCYSNASCDPFSGSCSRCADGYQNAKCNESKKLNASSCSHKDNKWNWEIEL